MNNTVRPIFNEKVVKKWYLWVPEQYTDVLFTVEKSMFAAKKIKKEVETRIAANVDAANADSNRTYGSTITNLRFTFFRWKLYLLLCCWRYFYDHKKEFLTFYYALSTIYWIILVCIIYVVEEIFLSTYLNGKRINIECRTHGLFCSCTSPRNLQCYY